jgi:hypothetical protein
MWLTIVNDSTRFTSSCTIAPRMPTTIVSAATTSSTCAIVSSPGNSSVWVRMTA